MIVDVTVGLPNVHGPRLRTAGNAARVICDEEPNSAAQPCVTVEYQRQPRVLKGSQQMRWNFPIVVSAALLVAASAPSSARGGGGHRVFGGGSAGRGQFAGGRRHGNDAYINAASEERDKLLDTKLKSICRGC
jgi:hypothetical protein